MFETLVIRVKAIRNSLGYLSHPMEYLFTYLDEQGIGPKGIVLNLQSTGSGNWFSSR